MPRLYLHIGTHKTGSTAIQESLRRAKSKLLSEKIVFLPIQPSFKEIPRLSYLDKKIVLSIQAFLQKYERIFSKEHTFVMSYEDFSGNLMQGYRNAPIVARVLKEATEGFEVFIVVYLRRQDTFLESIYTQTVHEGGSDSFEKFIANYDSLFFDWYFLLRSYADQFGKERIFVRRYDKKNLQDRNSLIDDFADIINSSALKQIEMQEIHNAGYSRDALEIARLCNPHLNIREKRQLRRIFQSSSAKLPFEEYEFLSFNDRKKILNRYSESNAKVAREYLKEKTGMLFSEPNTSAVRYEGLTPESVAKILTLAVISKPVLTDEELLCLKRLRKIESFFAQKIPFKSAIKRLLRQLRLI